MPRKTRERSATRTGSGRSRTGAETKPSPAAQQHIGSDPLNPEKLKRLYSTMLKCRMMKDRLRGLFKQGKVTGSYCTAIGQEATEVGAAIDLLTEDCVAPFDRDFIVSFIKGTHLKLIFARLRAQPASVEQGNAAPSGDGRTPLKIVAPASFAAHSDVATGVAMACKMQKRPFATLAFCGDGANSLDHWAEALRLAGARKLPIVFVIENSSGAEPADIGRRTAVEDLSVQARAYDFPGITVDGNDVVAVYRVAQEAIRRAREGHGPALIECKTSRGPAQTEHWKSKDPILFMERYLKRKDLWSDQWKQDLVDDFSKELDEAVVLAEQSPHSEPVRHREQVRSFEVLQGELNRKPLKFRRIASRPAKLGKS